MSVSILVATPHAAFGELLRLSLEESNQYKVRLVLTAKEALASASRSAFQLAILDSDLSEGQFVSLCHDLISQLPQMRFIVIPPDNNPNHPSLGGLMPHGYLNRPFYLPDLLETVHNLSSAAKPAETTPAPSTTPPDWASDPVVLQNALEQELAGTEAVAVLVGTQSGLLGSAGRLNEASALEMASVLLRYWDPKEKTDLMRYVRLSSTKGDYLVYATEIVSELVLIMVFDPSAQLGQVRPQTKQIALNLLSRSPEHYPPVETNALIDLPLVGASNGQSDHENMPGTALFYQHTATIIEPETERLDDEGLFSMDGESFINTGPIFPQAETGDALDLPDGEEEEGIDQRTIDLNLLLGVIPSPDPSGTPEQGLPSDSGILSGWYAESNTWQPGMVHYNAPDKPTQPESTPSGEQAPAEETEGYSDEVEFATRPIFRNPGEASISPSMQMPIFMDPEPEIDPLSDTRPHVVSTFTNINQMEPVSPALSLLNYTCVLLPRLPQHYLTGDLADHLAQWVQHLCLAFGWRLEGISLRPEYLQWTVQVAPSVSPGNLVRIIRQRTSLHIFTTFEHIKQQNPSGDFWATGYLIVSGPQPPSAQLLREYIAQTRKRQGIPKI
jgi:REP element-mobilizing transposase RayT/DNA-binding NarL/FixJ family response regulator